jgi:hypothetical protein
MSFKRRTVRAELARLQAERHKRQQDCLEYGRMQHKQRETSRQETTQKEYKHNGISTEYTR